MNKKPLSSKKFISFLISIFLIGSILVTALFTQEFNWPMAAMMALGMFAIGFIPVAYIFKQSTLDKFLSGVNIVTGNSEEKKDVSKDC